MSPTVFGTNSDSTVKLWAGRCFFDFTTDTQLVGQMTKTTILHEQRELSRSAGDRIRLSFNNRITQAGFIGNQSVSGLEAPMTYTTDDLLINELSQVVQIPAPMTIDYQRVLYNLDEDSYRDLSEWMQTRAALGVLNQLAGNTTPTFSWDGVTYSGTNLLQVTGLNPASAPTTTAGCTRIYRPNSLTTDEGVGADPTASGKLSDVLALEVIAQTQRPYIRPVTGSDDQLIKYHMYVHIYVYMDYQNDTSGPYYTRAMVEQSIMQKSGELRENQELAILSQGSAKSKVQRLESNLVHSSEWKRPTTHVVGDIVCSA